MPVRLVLIGLAAGVFGALFGVGGGIIIVPLLILLAAYPERSAMATSLAAIGLIAAEGTIFFALHGDIEPGHAALVGIPATVGVLAGTSLQQRLATRTLTLAFAGVLVAIAHTPLHLMDKVAIGIALGFLAGVLAGLFGVGGGVLFVPALSLALGLDQLTAQATSLLAMLPVVAVGTWRQQKYGHVRLRSALWLGVGGIVGVTAGGFLAISLPEHVLERAFGVLLLGVAAQLAIRALRPGEPQ